MSDTESPPGVKVVHLPPVKSFNKKMLLHRGWTRTAILRKLGAPDRAIPLWHHKGRPESWYNEERVRPLEECDLNRFRRPSPYSRTLRRRFTREFRVSLSGTANQIHRKRKFFFIQEIHQLAALLGVCPVTDRQFGLLLSSREAGRTYDDPAH